MFAVSGLGLPVELTLTAGQSADVTQAEALLECQPAQVVIADKGYDSDAAGRADRGVPGRSGHPRRAPTARCKGKYDKERYKDRNLAERFWAKVKQYRRVATRYDKTDRNFLAFVVSWRPSWSCFQ